MLNSCWKGKSISLLIQIGEGVGKHRLGNFCCDNSWLLADVFIIGNRVPQCLEQYDIAMTSVLGKKEFISGCASVLDKKLALFPHFLQDIVEIPISAPTFSSPSLPTLSLPQAL